MSLPFFRFENGGFIFEQEKSCSFSSISLCQTNVKRKVYELSKRVGIITVQPMGRTH